MNQLEEGMLFKSSIAVAKFLGYKDVSHSNQNLSRLSHYCDYERDDNNNIIIKKFLRLHYHLRIEALFIILEKL